jgi:phospholipid transport system substrate-binding protein
MRTLIALVVMALVSLSASGAEQSEAGKVVDTLHQALLDVMKRSTELGYKGRYSKLEPIVAASFDFQTIGRIVTGKYWAELKPDEQNRFLDTFARLSTATYASRFDSFGGEVFRQISAEKQSENKTLVKTELVDSEGKVVKFDYLLQAGKDNKWRILNVVADGISDLSLKRSEYTSIIKNQGYAALISKLDAKIAQYESPGT